ncbi:MAG: hypothetical protein HY062_11520, partial [Bacteroidetes bacterium]|nr:hypothetical protein [Bacteroidota bacterium]
MAKRLLLISLVSFLSFNLFSQTSYHKMFGDTNRWYVSGYIFGVKPSGSQNITNVGDPCIGYYKTEKDSMYNSKLYKIFEPDQILFCVGGSSFFSKTLVREDTISKKIFILHPDSVNECVAMDFGMTIGDSIYLPYSTYSYALKNGYYKLDSIASRPEILGPRQHFYL